MHEKQINVWILHGLALKELKRVLFECTVPRPVSQVQMYNIVSYILVSCCMHIPLVLPGRDAHCSVMLDHEVLGIYEEV